MTNLEFTQIMRGAGFEVTETDINQWYYLKNRNFFLVEDERKNSLRLHLVVTTKDDMPLESLDYKLTNVSQMNSIEFKKKLEGLTDYAYSLYMDINRHIDAISIKMETKAKRLGM